MPAASRLFACKSRSGAESLADRGAKTTRATAPLPPRCSMRGAATDQILLRTERAVYRAGRPHRSSKYFPPARRGAAYLDIVREGQTLVTRDIEIVNGQAELTLTATPDMAGTLDLNAYIIGRDARPVADHRLVFVQPADELKIEATADSRILQARRRRARAFPRDQFARRRRAGRAGSAGGG